MIVEEFDPILGNLKCFLQDASEIHSIKGCTKLILRINEPDSLELDNGVGNFLGPVPATRLDHSDRKSVKGNVENVTPSSLEPSC